MRAKTACWCQRRHEWWSPRFRMHDTRLCVSRTVERTNDTLGASRTCASTCLKRRLSKHRLHSRTRRDDALRRSGAYTRRLRAGAGRAGGDDVRPERHRLPAADLGAELELHNVHNLSAILEWILPSPSRSAVGPDRACEAPQACWWHTLLLRLPGTSCATPAVAPPPLQSLDWSVASSIWRKPNQNDSTCEATSIQGCEYIKAQSPNTRCFIYHNAELALQAFESQRAVMYDPTKANWFLQYTDGMGNSAWRCGRARVVLPRLRCSSRGRRLLPWSWPPLFPVQRTAPSTTSPAAQVRRVAARQPVQSPAVADVAPMDYCCCYSCSCGCRRPVLLGLPRARRGRLLHLQRPQHAAAPRGGR